MLKATHVLEDCRKAHQLLEAEVNEQAFRILWVAGIALARAVGHVLEKIDSKRNECLAKAIHAKYAEWKREKDKNLIFWNFIDDERNRVLKAYEQGFMSGPVQVVVAEEMFELDENLFKPLCEGAFAGEDCRDVLELAIEWWEKQLQEIEMTSDSG